MPPKPDRHDWNELNSYFRIHEAYLDRAMADGFVIGHDLDQPLVLSDEVILTGRIECQHDLFLDVDKRLEIMNRNGRLYIRTRRYNYQAMIVGSEPRPVFRDDNAHSYLGHPDDHHRHGVNYQDWIYIGPPQWIGHDTWPLLNEVIDELHQWWLTTGWQLSP